MRSAASGAPSALRAPDQPHVVLAACQLAESGAQAQNIKLNVIMRDAALGSTDAIEKACAKLHAEPPSDSLQAAQRVESTCALHACSKLLHRVVLSATCCDWHFPVSDVAKSTQRAHMQSGRCAR